MELRDRIEFVAEIARQKRGRDGRLGKTALMKLVYFLQEVFDVDLGYRFSLYTYGPYASEVMSDIDFAEAQGAIIVSYDDERGYEIAATSAGCRGQSVTGHASSLNRLFELFGNLNARELELRSTIVYLAKDCQRSDLPAAVQKIKPKFSKAEIELAIKELVDQHVISA